jgi:myo-inositol-1(or 4)-monophosphatase
VPDPIQVASETALAVGELLRERWNSPATVRHKGPVNLVTDADLAAESLAVRMLRDATPEYGIVAEERATGESTQQTCWHVDPLDGTTNYAHRFPHVAVSIALVRDTLPQIGVVYDPLRGELFTAACGEGARLNGSHIHVSATAALDAALLGTGFPYDRRERAGFYLRFFRHFLVRTVDLRRGGSAALDLCWVAAGRLDAFWEWNLQSWDTAAGAVIVAEASGTVSDFRGDLFPLGGAQLLASNGILHPALLAEFRALLGQPAV